MEHLKQLADAILELQKTNTLLASKLETDRKEPIFITTEELQERWRCKYALINSQMKKGLRSSKVSGKKMMFRLSVIKDWETENF